MLITSDTKERIDIPWEKDQWFDVRPLTWPQKEAASQERQKTAMANAADMPPEMLAAIKDLNRDQTRIEKFDVGRVLTDGLVAWSYTEPLNRDNLRLLDDRTATLAFEKIMALSEFGRAEGNGSTEFSTPGPSDSAKDGREN